MPAISAVLKTQQQCKTPATALKLLLLLFKHFCFQTAAAKMHAAAGCFSPAAEYLE